MVKNKIVIFGILFLILGIILIFCNNLWYNQLDEEYLIGESNPNELLENINLSNNLNYLFLIFIIVGILMIIYSALNKGKNKSYIQ
jgi:hypothetical protein